MKQLYSNNIYIELGNEEEIKEIYKEHLEINDLNIEDFSEYDMHQFAYDLVNEYFNDLLINLDTTENNNCCLCVGTVQTWHGGIKGGFIADNLKKAIYKALGDGDITFKVYLDDEGVFTIESTGHDNPTNPSIYKFYILTDKGEEYIEENEDNFTRQELHNKLLNNKKYFKNVKADF